MSRSVRSRGVAAAALLLALAGAGAAQGVRAEASTGIPGPFRRVASFPVFLNTSEDERSVAEIVAAADGGNLLVYTDGATGSIGFIDVTWPADPQPAGVVPVAGEPTSVAVKGRYALACVNTSPDFVNTSGELVVIDVFTRQVVRTLQLGGQPDAIAVSPSGRYAAIAIENERDEDLGNGEPPQAPPGFVVIVDLIGPPALWSTRTVDLVGVPDLYPEDPEPEFVDISAANVAAVTLQENNHVVLIRLADGAILADFPAGSADLDGIDADEDDLIRQDASLDDVPREPDAVAWLSPLSFATADEGDLFGGSRGFTTWAPWGSTLFEAGNSVERLVARLGHYPESRSENKGSEPEAVEYGRYGPRRYLFVGTERSNLVLVYELLPGPFFGPSFPILRQALPTGVGPEGLLAIPERDLFVVACEEDERGDKYRSTIVIYERGGEGNYPTIVSEDREDSDAPIPWAALSGLAVDRADDGRLFAVHDGYYRESRIFAIDRSSRPARITDEIVLHDSGDTLRDALNALKAQLPGTDDFDPDALVNPDGTVNLDLEGIAVEFDDGRYWLASEGAGNLVNGVSDPDDRPFESPNLLIEYLDSPGFPPFVPPFDVIGRVVTLPVELTRQQLRFGFEGIAVTGHPAAGEVFDVWVCFQRAWQDAGDPAGHARIGRYNLFSQAWTFAYYPLDAATSPNGGWVGLSELTHLGGDRFAVVERDDQGGTDARVKRLYEFSVTGVDFQPNDQAPAFPVLQKTLVLDLLAADTYGPTGGPVPEKLEGLGVLSDGTAVIVNDNDGVEDNSGETQLLEIESLFD